RLPSGFTDSFGGRRRDRNPLLEQLPVLSTDDVLQGTLDERKIRVVGNHSFRERGKLYTLLAEFVDLPHNFFNRPLAAVEDWTDLDCSGFNNGPHRILLSVNQVEIPYLRTQFHKSFCCAVSLSHGRSQAR